MTTFLGVNSADRHAVDLQRPTAGVPGGAPTGSSDTVGIVPSPASRVFVPSPTAPSYVPPPAPAPAPAPPPNEPATCRVISGLNLIAHNAGLADGVYLHTDGTRVAAGWVNPPVRSPGPDDVSFAWLNGDGRLDQWVMQGRPSRQRDHDQASSVVAQAIPVLTNGELNPRIDRRYLQDGGAWHYECGDVGGVFARVVQPVPDLPGVMTADWNAMFWCRTADVPNNPFVIAGRTTTNPDGTLAGEALIFGTRDRNAPAPNDAWRLRFDPNAVASARDPSDKLRDIAAPGKVSVVETPSGYGVAFNYRGHLHLGWLNNELQAIGGLRQVHGLGSTPGRTTMRWNGSEVVMVFADRASSSSLYTLQVLRVPFGQDPPQPVPLAATPVFGQNEIAPSLTRLDNRGFLLTWTYGPDSSRGAVPQEVYIRHYDSNMAPRGGALWLATGAADSEAIALNGNRAMVVVMQGQGSVREVASATLQCDQ